MPYIKNEIIHEVKQMDLLTYFMNYEPDELVKSSRNDYTTRSHTSLHISNGLWTWWTHKISGRSALDYLIKVKSIPFMDAVVYLKSCIDEKPCEMINQVTVTQSEKVFRLPRRNQDTSEIIRYLCEERCLDEGVIKYCIDNHFIYERLSDHAVVFLGYDEKNNVRFGCIRSITGSDKKDIYGSVKDYSFRILSKETSTTLHVFESAIDLLSQITLMKSKHKEWLSEDFLSIGGASRMGKDNTLPIGLVNQLERNMNVKTIVLHLDNDCAGRDTATKIKTLLCDKYKVIDECPRHAKDVNSKLQNKCRKKTMEVRHER